MPEKSSNAPVLRPGDVVNNRYLIREELGSGNFSNVYACFDLQKPENERASHPLALKILKREYKSDAYFEKKMLQLLDEKDVDRSAKVCKMYDFFEWKELPVFIMPVHGEPLRSRKLGVGRGVVTRAGVIQFAYELLETLHFIHFTCHMVHTDLKPENILIADRATPMNSFGNHWVVCDFGSASQWDMAHLDSDLISTRPYRAPEVVLGSPWFYAADIWSAGCIIFEVAVGNRLFEVRDDNTHLQLMAKRVGPLPELFTVKSRYSPKFFNRRGEVLSTSDVIRSGKVRTTPLKEVFHEDPKMLELLMALLTYDPHKRISASKALMLPVFDSLREARRQAHAAPAPSTRLTSPPAPPLSSAKSPEPSRKPTAPPVPVPDVPQREAESARLTSPAGAPQRTAAIMQASEYEEEDLNERIDDGNTRRPSRSFTSFPEEATPSAPVESRGGVDATAAHALPTVLPLPTPDAKPPAMSSSESAPSTTARPSPSVPAQATKSTTAPPVLATLSSLIARSASASHQSTTAPLSPVVPPPSATVGLSTPPASAKDREKSKDKEKEKRRKSDSKSGASTASGRDTVLNVDNLSSIMLDEGALEEAVQTATDKRLNSSKHARKSASGYLVSSGSGSVAEEGAASSPNSTVKERSALALPLSAAEVSPSSQITADADGTTMTPANAKTAGGATSSARSQGATASHSVAGPAVTTKKREKPAALQAPLLTSSEKRTAESVRPLSATAVGGVALHVPDLAVPPPPPPLPASETCPPDVVPLTVESVVAPVVTEGPQITAYETSTRRGARTLRRTSILNETSVPRLERSVSRDRAATASPSAAKGAEGSAARATGGVPSPSRHSSGTTRKVRRASLTSAAAARTPRGHNAARSPRSTTGGGKSGSRVSTPRAGGAPGVVTLTSNGVYVAPSQSRPASHSRSPATLSKETSVAFEPHSPLTPRGDKDGADGQGATYRMHRMPPALAAKTQRAANHRRNLESGAGSPATSTGGGRGGAGERVPRASGATLVASRPGPSAPPQTVAAGGSGAGAPSAASRPTSALKSHNPPALFQDEESETEMQSKESSDEATDEASRSTPRGDDAAHTIIADNRLVQAQRDMAGYAAPKTFNVVAMSLDGFAPLAVAPPYPTEERRGSATSAPAWPSMPPVTASSTPATRTTAANAPVPPPVTAARRTGTADVSRFAAQYSLKPPVNTNHLVLGGPDASATTLPGSVLREDTFFLDTPSETSAQQPMQLRLGLRAGESPSPGLEPSNALRPMALSPNQQPVPPPRFPRAPHRNEPAPLLSPANDMAGPSAHDTAVPSGLSAATSTTSVGTAERQMRAMIAKPRGLALSSSCSSSSDVDVDVDGTDKLDHPPEAPMSFGPIGASPYGTANVPRTGPRESDVYNYSQGSVDRLVAALYGGTNLDGAVTAFANASGPNTSQGEMPSMSATTVHATRAPAMLSYAGVRVKPPNLSTLAGAGAGGGVNPARGAATSSAPAGASGRRERRGSALGQGTRTNTGLSSPLLTTNESGVAPAGPRGRRPSRENTDLYLDEVPADAGASYAVPHANAAVRLPYSANPALSSCSPHAAGGGYGGLPPQQQPVRSQFTGLLPPTATLAAGSGARRPLPDLSAAAMPTRPIRPSSGGAQDPVSATNPSVNAPTATGRNITSTTGAGYSG